VQEKGVNKRGFAHKGDFQEEGAQGQKDRPAIRWASCPKKKKKGKKKKKKKKKVTKGALSWRSNLDLVEKEK